MAPPPSRRRSAQGTRKPFLDNTPLLLTGVVALVAALAVLLAVGRGSSRLAPDFLTDVVLSALSATNLTILVALIFVLARNIVKLVVERRRDLPFARFRGKLVAVLLGMALIPALLVLLVGSELIRNSVDRWFNQPMDVVLSSANAIAGDYYEQQQRLVSAEALRFTRALSRVNLETATPSQVRDLLAPEFVEERIDLVEVYRVVPGPDGVPRVLPMTDVGTASMPRGYVRDSADRLATRVAIGAAEDQSVETLPGRGDLIRTALPIRRTPDAPVTGVVVATEYLTDQFAARARGMTEAYEEYQQLRVLKQPLAGVYLSFFLMLTLMILVGATWMGLYLAKRITRPVQLLAAAAAEIGAGHLDHRVTAEANDEFGSMIDAFNRMAGDLAASRRRLERSAVELERKHGDVESRRRYVETILDRLASGVMSVDVHGSVRTWNAAASRLLGVHTRVLGVPVSTVLESKELRPLATAIAEAARHGEDIRPHEVSVTCDGREVHLAIMTTPLHREDGSRDGMVVVFDDVSPLVRAQQVAAWREVARRLAHEIKNPLTPIRLSAERLGRHFARAPEETRNLVEECTTTIVSEVEALKGLVDEFSQFARMPAPRSVATDLHAVLEDALALYRGVLPDIEFRTRFAAALPRVPADREQLRRVMLNLVDNAIEAMDRRGAIDIETEYDPSGDTVRIVVADEGPGIAPLDRDKLFLPYYSTKRRGSGLGLAIVRRIVAEHGGSITVSDNTPRGARFTIELPCEAAYPARAVAQG